MQVIGGTSDSCSEVGRWRYTKIAIFQLTCEQKINWMLGLWHLRCMERLKRPMRSSPHIDRVLGNIANPRINRALANPGSKILKFLLG